MDKKIILLLNVNFNFYDKEILLNIKVKFYFGEL